jgi:hypothetical protein
MHGYRPIYSNAQSTHQGKAEQRLHTAHDELHVTHKAMNDLKRLGAGHASFVEGKAVQSMKHVFYLALAQQFLRKLF